MTGSFRRILNKVLFVISWCVIMIIGSCLDSVPLTEWRVWVVLLISMVVMGVTSHEMDMSCLHALVQVSGAVTQLSLYQVYTKGGSA